jgi:exopolysaccharide biosynthesis polyprenyl glycosylphosphotransferase
LASRLGREARAIEHAKQNEAEFAVGAAGPEPLLARANEPTLRILEHRRHRDWTRRRGWIVRRALLAADLVGLIGAFLLAELIAVKAGSPGGRVDGPFEAALFLAALPVWVVAAKLYGLYDRDEERTDHSTVDDVPGIFHLVTVGVWLALFAGWLTSSINPDLLKLTTFWVLAIALVTLGRALARAWCRRTVSYVQNALIVCADDVGQLAARKLVRHPEYGINLVGFVDDGRPALHPEIGHLSVLGSPDRLLEAVDAFGVERVVIAFGDRPHERTLELVRSLKGVDVQVDVIPHLFELVSSNAGIHTIEGLPLVSLPPLRLSPSSRLLKRALDVGVSAAALLVLSPVFAAVAVAILVDSGRPVFFRQVRMGARDRTFRIVKFRTMARGSEGRRGELQHLNVHAENGGDARMFKAKDDPRVTRVGRFLRRSSLDELPQLWNVLRGDMSLVGPRPLPLEEDRHVGSWARRRLDLRPGMTGPWQVLGRSEIPFEEMVKLDYLYVTGWTLGSDLKLLARTIPVIFSDRGAY